MKRILRHVVLSGFLPFLVLAFLHAARADNVTLAGGTQMEGMVVDITFQVDGKETVYPRDKVLFVWLFQVSDDTLTLRSGDKIKGTFVSVRMKTVGGEMTYARSEVTNVKLAYDPLTDVKRTEYAARRAKVHDDDPKALLDLAEWCYENELSSEAADLARQVLKAQPEGEMAERAQALLRKTRNEASPPTTYAVRPRSIAIAQGRPWQQTGWKDRQRKAVPIRAITDSGGTSKSSPAVSLERSRLRKAPAISRGA